MPELLKGNPYEGTPLWARYYSVAMGWPVTDGVANVVDGPACCDGCGSLVTRDPATLNSEVAVRPLTLDGSYCFGCGALSCYECSPAGVGPHPQSAHYPGASGDV